MIIAGANSLDAKREWINGLNVFPVPDGDTGTNMCLTILSAIREMEKIENPTMESLSKAISSGSLRGARGNSGVILSQLLRGFAKAIASYEVLDKIAVCEALQKAVETAYKAVMKPKEGTILTVARAVSDKALELSCEDECPMGDYLDALVAEAERVLALTPDMLDVLKQAGVVDSGGQGLVEILKGARDAFQGKVVDYTVAEMPTIPVETPVEAKGAAMDVGEITFGYCTEFIINLTKEELSEEEEEDYRGYLNSLGDSIVLVAESDIVKTHVHTNDPGLVLQKALSFGSLSRIKIDNMREQHEEILIKDASRIAKEQAEAEAAKAEEEKREKEEAPKDYGFIAVSCGSGINEVFSGLGCDYLIEGGQTMNPSTEDLLKAIHQVNAKTIFLYPNNKNIIMAANQAAELTKEKKVIVIPTTTIPQGVTALINFVPGASVVDNERQMTASMETVKTGQVTYAIRDTVMNDVEIHEGDYMGIGDKTILSSGEDIETVVTDMVKEMVDETSSFLCVYYGEDIEEADAEKIVALLAEAYPSCEVELQSGGQPIYYYIVSVE